MVITKPNNSIQSNRYDIASVRTYPKHYSIG